MTTSITLRSTKGSALTHAEMDANLTNLQTTADAAKAATDTLTANKAEAAALGVANTDQNMGSFTGTTIADNVSAKVGMQSLETAVETKANATAVGVTSSAADMGTYTGTTIPDNETVKQNIQTLETAVEARPTSATLALTTGAAAIGANDASSGAKYTTVQGFITYLLSSVGSAIVGFIQSGTGAVATDIQTVLRRTVSIEDFRDQNAAEANATADMAAFTAAIAYANAEGGYVTIHLPSRTYRLNGPLPVVTASYVQFRGQSAEGTKLLCSGGGLIFDFTGSVCGFSDLQIDYTTTTAADIFARVRGDSSGFSLRNIIHYNVGTLLQLGNSTTKAYGTVIAGVRGSGANVAAPMISGKGFLGLFITNWQAYVAGVSNPTINRTSTMTTVSGRTLINSEGEAVDTLLVSGSCLFERWYRVLNMVATGNGAVMINIFVDVTTTCDYIRDDVYHFEAAAGSGGIIGVHVSGHLNSWEGAGVWCAGAGLVRGIRIAQPKIDVAGTSGIYCEGAAVRDISISDAIITAADRLNTGQAAVHFASGNDYSILGGKLGQDGTFGGFAWKPAYGIKVGADIPRIVIQGTLADGVTAAYDFAANADGGQGRMVTGNINADYSGFKTGGVFALPATTVPWINTFPYRVKVIVSGGTVSALYLADYTAVLQNTGLTSGSFVLEPGDRVRIDYTVAPSILFYAVP